MTIRLVITDDHPVVLAGIRHLVEQEPDMEVVACCPDARSALDAIHERAPDVLVFDWRMPDWDGMEILRSLSHASPGVRAIILTAEISEVELAGAISLGAQGMIEKGSATDLLIQCIRVVHAGKPWLPGRLAPTPRTATRLSSPFRQGGSSRLTQLELRIVRLVTQGMRNKEVAGRLGTTEGTIKAQLHRIYGRLGLTGRVDLANFARENGLL